MTASAGASPRAVTRGETGGLSLRPDWLTFRQRQVSAVRFKRWVVALLRSGAPAGNKLALAWKPCGSKWYREGWRLVDSADTELGRLEWNARTKSGAGTMVLNLSGHGCALLREPQWKRLANRVRVGRGVITRLDLALDDLSGQIIRLERVPKAHAQGRFRLPGGAPPKLWAYSVVAHGKATPETLYVGNRKSGKTCRFYRKGIKDGGPKTWNRAELELRNRDRDIPWLALLPENWAGLFAGGYPYLSDLLKAGGAPAPPWRLKTDKAPTTRGSALQRLTRTLSAQYGPQLLYWSRAIGPETLVDLLAAKGPSRTVTRLLEEPPDPELYRWAAATAQTRRRLNYDVRTEAVQDLEQAEHAQAGVGCRPVAGSNFTDRKWQVGRANFDGNSDRQSSRSVDPFYLAGSAERSNGRSGLTAAAAELFSLRL